MSLRPLVLVVVVVAMATGTPAGPQDYPWCSNFADGAGVNCGFTSYEQCMATARGTGGYCAPNAMLKPSIESHGARTQRARKRRSPLPE